MRDSAALLALWSLQAAITGLFAIVFIRYWRVYRRPELKLWGLAWAWLAAHMVTILVEGLVTGGDASSPQNLITIVLHGFTSYLAILYLVAGAMAFGWDRPARAGFWRISLLVTALLSLLPAALLTTGAATAATVPFFQMGFRGLATALASVAVLTAFWLNRQENRPFGYGITAVGLIGMTATQLHYGWYSFGLSFLGRPRISTIFLAVPDAIVWITLGVGLVAWLLDEERNRAVAAAHAEIALQRRLAEDHAHFRAIVDQVGDMITVVDPEGVIDFRIPGSTREYFGHQAGELDGVSTLEFVHPDDRPAAREGLRRAVADPSRTVAVELRLRHRDGSWLWAECSARSRVDDPMIGGIILSARDISDRKRLEGELARAAHLESVGRLAGGVAHDFNNLLTVIRGAANLAREITGDGGVPAGELDEIEAAAERGAVMVRRLLTFARKQAIAPRVIDLNDLVSGLREMLIRLLGETIDLRIQRSVGPAVIRADPGQIEQVVVNLVTNARDAMPAGGPIEIEVAAGASVELTVRDGGIGMTAEVQQRLFEPFFTTKEVGAGTGLGLAVCHGIVAESGGGIAVESRPGYGTTVRVTLPRADGEVRPPRRSVGAAERGTERILLVEDEEGVRSVASRLLKRLGYDVTVAEHGLAALAIVEAAADPFDCLVTDVVMPELGGFELAARLRVADPGLPIVLTSGYLTDPAHATGQLAQPVLFVPKPYRAETLGRAVRAVLDRLPAARPFP